MCLLQMLIIACRSLELESHLQCPQMLIIACRSLKLAPHLYCPQMLLVLHCPQILLVLHAFLGCHCHQVHTCSSSCPTPQIRSQQMTLTAEIPCPAGLALSCIFADSW